MKRFWQVIEWVLAIMLLVMMIMVFSNVVLRYGFYSGIRASEELSRLMFVWIVMLGAAVCMRYNEHIALTEFAEKLVPATALRWIRAVLWSVILIAMLMVFVGAWEQTLSNWKNISPLTGLPKGIFYFSGVVSALFMCVLIGQTLYRLIFNKAPT